ncbi:MAG: hypothetical protein U0703_27730 [Anaerolineae bacterium]
MSNENFDALWDYDHPAETEKTFRALLAQTDGARRFELLTQIARAQGLQGISPTGTPRWTKWSAT